MAKAPKEEIISRVRIHAEKIVSVPAMGDWLVKFNRAGFDNIGYELITDVAGFKKRNVFDQSAAEAMAEYIKDHPTFAIKDAIKHFKEVGRSAGSIYMAARVLVEKGVLKQLGDGNYSLADLRQVEGPKTAAAEKAPRRTKTKRN